MTSYLFTQAQTDLTNATLDLSSGTYYAHLVTTVPNASITTVGGLALPATASYTPKILTGLIYDSSKWTFDNTSWSPLSFPIAPVGTVICKQTGSIPANTDRIICYSDRSQVLNPGVFGITETFPTSGIINFRSDPFFNNRILLCHFDGADNSNVFIDQQNATISQIVAGQSIISANNNKFGGSSLLVGMNGLRIDLSLNNALYNLTGAFTISAWIYLLSNQANQAIISRASLTNNISTEYSFYLPTNSSLAFYYGIRNVNQNQLVANIPPLTLNSWHHVEISRDNTNIVRFFADGVLSTSGSGVTNSSSFGNIQNPVNIGCLFENNLTFKLDLAEHFTPRLPL